MRQSLQIIEEKLDKPLTLTGLMGAGKSSVGLLLADILSRPFYDSDQVIVEQEGRTIEKIFSESGENFFRKREGEVIKELLEQEEAVISLGGGAVLKPETLENIKKKSISIWLDADVDTLVRRLAGNNDRPLLKNQNPHTVLNGLLDERRPFYEKADIHVQANGPVESIINDVLESLEQYLSHE